MSDTYPCPQCGGDRDALLSPVTDGEAGRGTSPPRPGALCTCTQNSRTSGAFGARFTPDPNSAGEG